MGKAKIPSRAGTGRDGWRRGVARPEKSSATDGTDQTRTKKEERSASAPSDLISAIRFHRVIVAETLPRALTDPTPAS